MEKVKSETVGFATRWGLVMSLVGLAVGTGNIWRFPRMAALNGGGAFIVAYTVMWAIVAIPVMMGEHAIGRATRHGLPGAFKDFVGKKFTWMGTFMVIVVVGIMSYYSVVVAWVMRYLVLSVTKGYYDVDTLELFDSVSNGSPLTVLFFVIALGLTAFIVSKGISGGIEKAMKVLMPCLFLCLLVVLIRALTLPNAVNGLEFLFQVDASYLTKSTTWLNALTQVAWSAGPGWGLILTYAVYTKSKSDIALNTVTQAMGDSVAALIASMAIIPALFAMVGPAQAAEIMASGNNGLTFVSLTALFAHMPLGYIVGILFFLALLFAGISSNVGHVLLPAVPFVDAGSKKKKAVLYMFVVALIWGLPSAWNADFFNNQDWVAGILLLFGTLFTCFGISKFNAKKFRQKFINTPESEFPVGPWFELSITVLTPICIVIMLAWWVIQTIAGDPSGWWHPFGISSVGTIIFQGVLIFLVSIAFNGKISNSIKHKYFNGEDFPEIPPEHQD